MVDKIKSNNKWNNNIEYHQIILFKLSIIDIIKIILNDNPIFLPSLYPNIIITRNGMDNIWIKGNWEYFRL